ncbi:MAG: DEAD/DEAH box helicase [Candidatus Pacebacteria bacterium]|nr:DEAD/DEAH box helicase [Candidatus Paceibacterota bacterium]
MLSKDEKIRLFRTLFHGREDVFARRWQKYEGGVSGYTPVYRNWKKKDEYEPLTDKHIENHLLGNTTLGVYPLQTDNTSYFAAVDFDGERWQVDVQKLLQICDKHHMPVYTERSRSGNGAHVWCFFNNPYPAYKSRAIFLTLLRQAKQIDEFDKDDSFDRMFPNQDYLSGKGLGNLIALPLQGQSRKQSNTVFVDPGNAYTVFDDQWDMLSKVRLMTTAELDALYAQCTGEQTVRTPRQRASKKSAIDVTVSNSILIPRSSMNARVSNYLRDELNFLNADYIIKQRMGYNPYNIEKYFKTIQTVGDTVSVPRGFLHSLERFCREQGIALRVKDERSDGKRVAYQLLCTLRDYQKKAVEALSHEQGGVLIAPPGAGKTIIGIALIAALKRNALILTHRRQIHDQWIDSISAFLGIPKKDIGKFSSTKKSTDSQVSVAMVQTLARMSAEELQKLHNTFGIIIVDECHHMPARLFRDVVSKFNPRYLFGLTATPKRKNNDEKLIYAYIGDIVHTIQSSDLRTEQESTGVTTTNELEVVIRNTNIAIPFKPKIIDFNVVARILCNDATRNAQIREDVLEQVKSERTCLILTERREHADMLEYYLKRDVECVVLTGDLTPKKREVVEKRIRGGDFQVLIATGHILGEGADIPILDCLFLAFPIAFEGKLIQYIGRIQRGGTGARTVFDYCDEQIEMLDKMFKKRQRYYNKLQ